MRRTLLVLVVLAGALVGPVASADARRVVPSGFFGSNVDGPLQFRSVDLPGQSGVMARSGVESVRFVAYWHIAQPYRTFSEVPADQRSRFRNEEGVPTNWSEIDRMVREAARRGLRAMPVLLNAPLWGRQYPDRRGSPPDPRAFARFAGLMVRRYGPTGVFWRENPSVRKVPVRYWQILNEVNHPFYWNTPGSSPSNAETVASAPGYAALLRVVRPAIKRADPRAKVVHAGIDGRAWRYLRALYRAGGRRLFDVYAVHPFTHSTTGQVLILRYVRRVMNRARDGRKQMAVTEWSWPSAKGHASDPDGFSRTLEGQARGVTRSHQAFVRWRRRLRLNSVFHYTWVSYEAEGNRFTYSGLSRFSDDRRITPKPALRAFAASALAYEGCRRKSATSATRCLRRRR